MFNNNARYLKFVPIIAIILGAVLGVVEYYTAPETIGIDSVLTAIIMGGFSGITATGTNQVVKQINKYKKIKNVDKNSKVVMKCSLKSNSDGESQIQKCEIISIEGDKKDENIEEK